MVHENELRGMAQKFALADAQFHSYLPKTAKEAENFHVHRWGIDAMASAYRLGIEHAVAEMRNRSVAVAHVMRDYEAKP